jgi:hypothetical protein
VFRLQDITQQKDLPNACVASDSRGTLCGIEQVTLAYQRQGVCGCGVALR